MGAPFAPGHTSHLLKAPVQLKLRQWRLARGEPYGMLLWFDPLREVPVLWSREPEEDAGVPEYRERDEPDLTPEINIFDL